MKTKLQVIAALLLSVSLSTPSFAQTSKSVAKVNGVAISSSSVEMLRKDSMAQGAPDSPDFRNAMLEELIRREVLSQEAKKKGLDKQAATQTRIELMRQNVLVLTYLENWAAAHPVSDQQVRAEYDQQVKAFGDKEYKVRHILVDKEEDAQAIIKKLQNGGKFDDLAKESKDSTNKSQGGDLGWVRPSGLVPPFADAMVKLEKGKYTQQPVKSQFGYHVIMLEDMRKSEPPPKFDDVKDRIKQGMTQQAVQKHIAELVSKAKVERE